MGNAYEPADAGETAKPWPYEVSDLGPPKPDPSGPFLLILHDENQQGWLRMRRYRTKEEAVMIAANYLGRDQVWLYEVGRELDISGEIEQFCAAIEIA